MDFIEQYIAMNKFDAIKEEFSSGKIDKWQYIDKMYEIHSMLFEYAAFIKNKNISSIEINDDKVTMTFRDSDIKFICSKGDKRLASFDTLNFGTYEIEELNMQLNLIDEGYNVFDIGGNFGWYALHIAKLKQKSKVYTFEPIPSTYNHLVKNVELNRLTNIIANNFGFSDAEGSFDFYYNPTLSVNASLANVSGNTNISKAKCIVKKLDEFTTATKKKVDFIKCDVEGAELLVFKGGVETIKRDKPVIFTEMLKKWTAKFNYHPNDIINLLSEIGYQCFVLDKNKLNPFVLVDENTMETNYFFLHGEKHAEKIKKYTIV
jgi:FkbM family methyltransferase